MEETKEFDFDEAIGYFYTPLSREEKKALIDIIIHTPKDISYMILRKLPPILIIDLCRENQQIKKLCDKKFREKYLDLWNIGFQPNMKKYLRYPKAYYKILSFFYKEEWGQDYVANEYRNFVDVLGEEIVEGRIDWEIVKQIPKDDRYDTNLGILGNHILGSRPFRGRADFYAYVKNGLQRYDKQTGAARQFFDWDKEKLRRGWKP